jgi:hypothetical protein
MLAETLRSTYPEGTERAKTGERLQLTEIEFGTAFRKREIAASHRHYKTIQRRG